MKVLKFLGLCVLAAAMFGCAATAPSIQVPATRRPIDVTSKDFAQFGVARIRNDMAPGKVIGAHYDGLTRTKVRDYHATGLLSSHEMERYRETVLEELSDCGYKVADQSSLFGTDESYASRFLVGGKLLDGTFQSFGSVAGNYTEVLLEIEWQVFDNATGKVIHKAVTKGYAKVDGVSLEADFSAFRNCFRNFLADRRLVAAIQGSTIAREITEEPITVAHRTRNPAIEKSPNKIDMIKKGVFAIKTEGRHGSGFVINPKGYGITNYHVIGERKVFDAIFADGKTIRAKVIWTIPEKDLALVKLTGEDYFYLPLAAPERVSAGKEVYAIGSPLSLGLSHSVSRGVISGIRKLEPVTLVQTDASMSPGSSGGPLIDPNGLVLGVITVKVSQFGVEGIGFAVSSSDIIEVLKTPPSPKQKREPRVAAKTPRPEEPEEVRIGVVTKLERKYFAHLKEVLGKRRDCELMEILDPISYDKLDVDTAGTLGQRYQIDMIISVDFRSGSGDIGRKFSTKLIDVSDQRMVKLKLDRWVRTAQKWEKVLVREQVGPIVKMIEEIYREKRKSKL